MTKQDDLAFEETGENFTPSIVFWSGLYCSAHGRRQEDIGSSSIPLICVCIRWVRGANRGHTIKMNGED